MTTETTNPAAPQPAPTPASEGATPIVDLVIADLRQRAEAGRAKYGTLLFARNGRDALVDLYQELLDGANYVRQVIEEDRARVASIPLHHQAAEIDSLRAGLRALTNIRDESAAETHRWRERALAAETETEKLTEELEALKEQIIDHLQPHVTSEDGALTAEEIVVGMGKRMQREIDEACEVIEATPKRYFTEEIATSGQRVRLILADLDLAVSFARRGWEEARAWRERVLTAETSIQRAADEAYAEACERQGATEEAKALRGQRDDLAVELRKRTAELEEERTARAKAETEMKTILAALDPTSARAEPEEAPEPRDLAAIGRDALVWAREMFGPEVDERPVARSSKVLEEAAELAQAEGLDAGRARRIVERVYSRPEGEPEHEGAQVAVTMAAWASARGLDLLALAAEEVDRIRRLDPKAVRAKHAEKARAGIAVGPTTAPEPEPTIDPGEGWRLLRKGEKIEAGDEVYFRGDNWFESEDVGLIHLGEDDPPDMVRRRRIAAPAVPSPAAAPVDPAAKIAQVPPTAYPPSGAADAVEPAPPQPVAEVCSAGVASEEPRAQHPEQHAVAEPAPRPALPRPMRPELRAAIIRAQMEGGAS